MGTNQAVTQTKFASMTIEKKGMTAIEFLEENRSNLASTTMGEQIIQFIIDSLEHHILR